MKPTALGYDSATTKTTKTKAYIIHSSTILHLHPYFYNWRALFVDVEVDKDAD